METNNTVIDHGYFAVTGFEMQGGVIYHKKGFSIFEQALIDAKNQINHDESKCAVVKRQKNTYEVYVKKCNKASPNTAQNSWKEIVNIFYGKRMKVQRNIESKDVSSLAEFDYYFISNLDMYGQDIRQIEKYPSFQEAFEAMRKAINFDSTKCGTIHQAKQNCFVNYMKDAKGTSPLHSPYHSTCTSVFFGRKV